MTPATHQSLTLFLSGYLAQGPAAADAYLSVHPEQAALVRQYREVVGRMAEWHEGQIELVQDANGVTYVPGAVAAVK